MLGIGYSRPRIVQQEMRDDAKVTRHQILDLGHDSLAQRRHSVILTLGVWELGGVEERPSRGGSVAVSLPPDLTAVVCR